MEALKFNQLLQKIKTDLKSFDALYDFYYARIVRHLTVRFGKKAAEDAAHDFFIKLLTSDTKPEYIRKPTTWVYTCCDNLAKTALKKEGKEVPLAGEIEFYPQFPVVDISSDVSAAIGKLDQTSRKIVYLHYWEGYNLEEISEMIDMSYPAVRKRHSRIKAKLKKLLK